jgi:hypothetical protein
MSLSTFKDKTWLSDAKAKHGHGQEPGYVVNDMELSSRDL